MSRVLEACSFIKKESLAQVFSCEFCEIFKSTFFKNTVIIIIIIIIIIIYLFIILIRPRLCPWDYFFR